MSLSHALKDALRIAESAVERAVHCTSFSSAAGSVSLGDDKCEISLPGGGSEEDLANHDDAHGEGANGASPNGAANGNCNAHAGNGGAPACANGTTAHHNSSAAARPDVKAYLERVRTLLEQARPLEAHSPSLPRLVRAASERVEELSAKEAERERCDTQHHTQRERERERASPPTPALCACQS